jgi:hypothetical protein
MVRRGSTVRVRQRALQKRRTRAVSGMCSVGAGSSEGLDGADYGAFASRTPFGLRAVAVDSWLRDRRSAQVHPSHIQLEGWGWFLVWALLGAAAALGSVSAGSLLLVPVVALGVFLWTRPRIRHSGFGLLTGAGVLLLYVAWVQRDGPGTTCWHTATASGCDQHLNPLPWLLVGAALVVAGFVAHARRS